MKERFRHYLLAKGYSEVTPSGNPSTVYDYIKRIDRVCEWEGVSWEMLSARIEQVVQLYDHGGVKEELGNKSHRAVINALRRFMDFVRSDT